MTLRERVLDGQIDAGAGLTESDVAAKYDVSRPTARTAISLPVHEGLLRRQAHKSAYVPKSSRKDVEDLAALPAGAAHSTFVEADLRFHHALVEAVDSPRLYAGRSGEIHLSMVQPTTPALGRDRIVAEHRAILDALDPAEDAAEARVRSHPEGARDALADQFDTITDRAAPA